MNEQGKKLLACFSPSPMWRFCCGVSLFIFTLFRTTTTTRAQGAIVKCKMIARSCLAPRLDRFQALPRRRRGDLEWEGGI
ncbi:hypothetical protein BGY98DRAFT_411114 [Russula aff. rugulosa BPL654]|nr:hypothetical protein BGY98DRAFT_411114 [Russula aff. rugulosa BPL654]